jgi:uncharacterized FlgJ-related protein
MKIILTESQYKTLQEQFLKPQSTDNQSNTDPFANPFNLAKEKPLPFSQQNLQAELKKQGVVYPDVALAQSKLETGNWTSNIFRDNHNLFGMQLSHIRKTTAKGKNRGHALYDNWQDSVKDYKLWQDYYKVSSMTKQQFIQKLNSIYCIPPTCGVNDYSKKIYAIVKSLSGNLA